MEGKKYRLLIDLPIDPKHKAFEGSEFECVGMNGRIYLFNYVNGLEFGAFGREIVLVKNRENDLCKL